MKSFSSTSGFKLPFDSSSWYPFGSFDEPENSKVLDSTDENTPDPFFDLDSFEFESDFNDDWDGESEEPSENTEDVENFSEGGEGAEEDDDESKNTEPTSLNWKWDDFGWDGLGSAENTDDNTGTDDEDVLDFAKILGGDTEDVDEHATESDSPDGSPGSEKLQGRSGMRSGRFFNNDFLNGLGGRDLRTRTDQIRNLV